MEILIYRHDENESDATVFTDTRQAIDFMKQRAAQEKMDWSEYIIKPKDDSQ